MSKNLTIWTITVWNARLTGVDKYVCALGSAGKCFGMISRLPVVSSTLINDEGGF